MKNCSTDRQAKKLIFHFAVMKVISFIVVVSVAAVFVVVFVNNFYHQLAFKIVSVTESVSAADDGHGDSVHLSNFWENMLRESNLLFHFLYDMFVGGGFVRCCCYWCFYVLALIKCNFKLSDNLSKYEQKEEKKTEGKNVKK